MASQLERERMAESTARYHHGQGLRWLIAFLNAPADPPEEFLRTWKETSQRARYHRREAEAAEVRLVAIQLEGVTFDDLARAA